MGRHTLTGTLCTAGRQFSDWSADYRLFSHGRWSSDALFGAVRQDLLQGLAQEAPLVTALDDSYLKKTGAKIPGVKYVRDPMSPPFRPNFIRGQRFCQLSALLPNEGEPGPARGIPLQYHPVPPVAKPKPTAPAAVWKEYRRGLKEQSLPQHGAFLITQLRRQMDEEGSSQPGSSLPSMAVTPMLRFSSLCRSEPPSSGAFAPTPNSTFLPSPSAKWAEGVSMEIVLPLRNSSARIPPFPGKLSRSMRLGGCTSFRSRRWPRCSGERRAPNALCGWR